MLFEPSADAFSPPNAQILAQASAISYDTADKCQAWASAHGFDPATFHFLDEGNTQGFIAENPLVMLVAFRGTQPDQTPDWLTDANAVRIPWRFGAGEVHAGFDEALEAVWDDGNIGILPRRLLENKGQKKIWITGHSLGGGLAELCAARAFSALGIPIQGVYTFGQPRVGDESFAERVQSKFTIFRMINDRDIVPRIPLFTAGYRHYGAEVFFDHDNKQENQASRVENLPAALRLAKFALDLDLQKLVRLTAEAAEVLLHPDRGAALLGEFKNLETQAFNLNQIRQRTIANIDDHAMKHYMARLGNAL